MKRIAGSRGRRSGAASHLLETTYRQSASSLFIEKARKVRLATGVSGPPFNPFDYAKALDIDVSICRNTALDGRLVRNDDGRFEIVLKRSHNRCRMNFTLAHEIAHTFFYDLLAHPKRGGQQHAFDPDEERLCDIGAAELLMPFEQFKRDTSTGDLTAKAMLELQHRYQVSLHAALIRLVKVLDGVVCAIWQQRGPAMSLKWVSPCSLRSMIVCQTGHSSVELALKEPGVTFLEQDSYYGIKAAGLTRGRTSSFGLSAGEVLSILWLPENRERRPAERDSHDGAEQFHLIRAMTAAGHR